MYNAEKYIGACLMSILEQTFPNYEVIVVDDCSTDASCAVVESFIPKFGGRLKLSHMKQNSGGSGAPTNKAVALSVGKYIMLLDNDDLLMPNATEILYTAAEKFQADVVHMDRHVRFNVGTEEPFPKRENIFLVGSNFAGEPSFESDDVGVRLQKIFNGKFGGVEGWRNFVRRDFFIENEITFPNLPASQDMVLIVKLIFFAKKFLHISDLLYVNRARPTSVTRTNTSDEFRTNFGLEVEIKNRCSQTLKQSVNMRNFNQSLLRSCCPLCRPRGFFCVVPICFVNHDR